MVTISTYNFLKMSFKWVHAIKWVPESNTDGDPLFSQQQFDTDEGNLTLCHSHLKKFPFKLETGIFEIFYSEFYIA